MGRLDRPFTADDLWRIYCNNLTGLEQVFFKETFMSADGVCGDEKNPCNELQLDAQDAINAVKEFVKVVEAQLDFIQGIFDDLSDVADNVDNFFDGISGFVEHWRETGREDMLSDLDDTFKKAFPNDIERAEKVGQYAKVIDGFGGGGFLKSERAAELFLKRQGLWKPRGELIIKSKEMWSVQGAVVTSALVFIGVTIGKLIEVCSEDV